jgi:ferric-dicitrate binding protein FerR (iron transport regulator)
MTLDDFKDTDWDLLVRHFSGTCSSTDEQTLERWIAAYPGRRREIDLLRAAWDQAAHIPIERRAHHAFPRVAARVGLEVSIAAEPSVGRRVPRFEMSTPAPRSRWLAIATRVAAVVVFALFGWVGWERVGHTNAASPAREFVTQPAQRQSIDLSDGTHVTLGPASRLSVPAGFGGRTRTVTIDGDAYFTVPHDARRPFRVRTATTVTEDLGTAFVIQVHPRDNLVDVIVVEGRVALRSDTTGRERGVALSRGQLGRVGRSGLVSVTDSVDVAALLGWMEGKLTFRKTPLADVRRVLERWYDVRIELADSTLARIPVSASFDGQSADQALGSLAQLLGVRYARSGSNVRFLPRAKK